MSKLHTLSPLDNFISYLQDMSLLHFHLFHSKKKKVLISSFFHTKSLNFPCLYTFSPLSFLLWIPSPPSPSQGPWSFACFYILLNLPLRWRIPMSKQWRSSTYHLQNLCTQWLSNYQPKSLFPFSAKFLPLSQHHQKSCLHWLAPIHSSTCSNLAGTLPAPVGRFLNAPWSPCHQVQQTQASHFNTLPRIVHSGLDPFLLSWLPWHYPLLISHISRPLFPLSVLHYLNLNIRISLVLVWIVFSFPFYPIFLGNHTHSCWCICCYFMLIPKFVSLVLPTYLTSPFACFTGI